MRKCYSSLFLLCLFFFQVIGSNAQTISTTALFSNNNGSGIVTFNLQNTNAYGLLLNDFSGLAGGTGSRSVEVWYNTAPVNTSTTPTISTANGWVLISSGTINSTSTTVLQPFFTGLNFLLPANTTYGFAVNCTSQPYFTIPASLTTPISVSGLNFLYGTNISWGGPSPSPPNMPRGWIGEINFTPALPCTSPPTSGTSVASASSVCSGGTVNLSLTGNSIGTSQTYQWQTCPTIAGSYTNIGTSSPTANYTATTTATLYYRCAVTCGTSTTYSTPVLVTVPGLFPAGTYTINSAIATGGSNFQTFTAAVSAVSCGTTGPVIFNVAASSGPYNEQIVIPQINTNSATNTITFNCNNTTLSYTNTSATNYAILKLDGADYIRFKKLNVIANTASTAGFGIQITNDADNNIIDSCSVIVDVPQTSTGTTYSGIVVGGSATSATTGTFPCDSNIISNNTVTGGYYCVTNVGTSTGQQYNNKFINNNIQDYYLYGMYMLYNTGTQVIGNELHRNNRVSVSTFYGVVNTTGNLKSNIANNRIHNPFGAAVTSTSTGYFLYNAASATAGNENVFSNNIVYNMDGNGTHYIMYSLGNYGRYYHNTISADYTAATAGSTYCYYQSSTYTGIEVKNNIISLTRGGTGAKYGAYHSAAGYTTVMNNNDYYVSGTGNSVGYNGTAQATLANWQTASSQDAASVAINPVFTAPLTGNLKPTATTLDNLGAVGTGISTDILGFTRSATTPDMGAYEFGLPPCLVPTALAASAITFNSATLTWTAPTGATGYEYVLDQVATNPAGAGTPITASPYNAAGLTPLTTYYFHLRNSCGSGSFSGWVTISFTTVCAPPIATITPQSATTFCTPGSVVLKANSDPALTYQWKIGGVIIPGATDSSYTASASGSYTVVTTISTCNTTSAATVVTINPKPDTTVTMAPASGIVCSGNSVTVTGATAAGATYQWYKNGVAIAGANAVSYAATTSGDYRLQVTNATSCSDTSGIHTVTVIPMPVATISPSTGSAVCQGSSLLLTGPAPATGITYQWQRNGADISGANANTYSATTAGNYRVVVMNGICADTSVSVTINVNPTPGAAATTSGALAFCQGGSVLLTSSSSLSSGATYQWLRNGFNVGGATNPTYSATTTGNYTVKITNTATGCADTSSPAIVVTVSTPPSTSITQLGTSPICQGSTIRFTSNNPTSYTYQWYNGATPIAGATSNIYTANAAGSYYVVIVNGTCTATTTPRTVVVNPLPTVAIVANGPTAFCNGGSVILDGGTTTGLTYQWRRNAVNIAGATSATYTATQTGIYTLQVTNVNGCQAISNGITVTVSTQPVPVITSSGATTFCQGNSITLQATTGAGYTYQWLLAGNPISGATSDTYGASASGNYTVVITNGTCVATSAQFAVNVLPAPPAVITPAGPTAFCQGGSVLLNANRAAGLTYQWTHNTVDIPGATGYQYTAVSTGTYTVKISDGTCPATAAAISVTVNDFPIAVITVTGGVNLSTDPFSTYQWYRNGVLIPGAISQTYTAVRDGFYAVVVSDALGCSATSSIAVVNALDVNGVNGNIAVKVYPNPTNGMVMVDADFVTDLSVMSIDGRELMSAKAAKSIDISAMPQGLYLIRITNHSTGQMIALQKINKK